MGLMRRSGGRQAPVDGAAVDRVVNAYIAGFVAENTAARTLAQALEPLGVGLRPIVDHITVRTLDVDSRAKEFLDLSFEVDEELGVLEYDDWWAKVYRRSGFPAVFIDQPFEGKRGEKSVIRPWVNKFGDKVLHHIAVAVGNIEQAITHLKSQRIESTGQIVGEKGGPLRQIFTAPEVRDGQPFSVLELAERHAGFLGFSPPQADGLMKSTVLPGQP